MSFSLLDSVVCRPEELCRPHRSVVCYSLQLFILYKLINAQVGIVVIPAKKVNDQQRVFVEIHLQFRYVSRSHCNAAYNFQFSNYFQLFWIYVAKGNKLINWFFKKTAEKTIVLAKKELSPMPTETPAVDVYPFNLKFPQRIPPSFDAPQCAFFAGSSFLPEEFELSLDKTMVYYGEKLDLHVAIDNNSNKRIRRIKCQLIQLSLLLFVGERRKPFSCLETKEC